MWSDLTAIVPAYRCARYLPAAVQGLLRCPVRIIITEDCGGDDTIEVARGLQTRFPDRITVLQNPQNLGVSRSINRTLESVQTKYVLKMDADDVILSSYVQSAYDFIWRHDGLGMICGGCESIGPADYLSGRPEPTRHVQLDGKIQILSGADACRFILRWDPYPCSSGAIYRTEALKSSGGYAPGLQWAEDREIWFRIARRWPVAYCDVAGTLYRKHPESLTAQHRAQHLTGVQDGQLIQNSRNLWPEPELLPDFARSFYKVWIDCRRSSREALESGLWEQGIRCGGASIRYLIRAGVLSLRSLKMPSVRVRIPAPASPEKSAHPDGMASA